MLIKKIGQKPEILKGEITMDEIGAIGGGMGMGAGFPQISGGLGNDNIGQVAGGEGIDKIGGGEGADKIKVPAENPKINEQDSTEISDEAVGEAGAAQAAQGANQQQPQAQGNDVNNQIRESIQAVIQEQQAGKVNGDMQSQEANKQGGGNAVQMLKEQLNACKENGNKVEPHLVKAGEAAIGGDIQKAEALLKEADAGKANGAEAAQGLNQDQQVGKAGEANVSNIVSNIKDMMGN